MPREKNKQEFSWLPFVGKGPCDVWRVKSTGDYRKDLELGKSHAEAYLKYLATSKGGLGLSTIIAKMYRLKKQTMWINLGFMRAIQDNLNKPHVDPFQDRPLDRLADAYKRLPDLYKPSAHALIDACQQHDTSLHHKVSGNVVTVDFRRKYDS